MFIFKIHIKTKLKLLKVPWNCDRIVSLTLYTIICVLQIIIVITVIVVDSWNGQDFFRAHFAAQIKPPHIRINASNCAHQNTLFNLFKQNIGTIIRKKKLIYISWKLSLHNKLLKVIE